jgi:predicted nucleic acid-binding Zn ribbon protein
MINVITAVRYLRGMYGLPEHGHCGNCGDPVGFNENFCSDECSKEYEKDVNEAKKLDTRFYLIMGIGVAVAAVAAFLVKIYVL